MKETPEANGSELLRRGAASAPQLLLARARERSLSLHLGFHASKKKGSGVDFTSHRAYSPGDDLRHLDRHAMARHKRLLVREFEREAQRPLIVLVEGGTSMRYASPRARESKLARAAFLSVASVFVAARGRDPIGLVVLGSGAPRVIPPRTGLLHREHVIGTLLALLESDAGGKSSEPDSETLWNELSGTLPASASLLWFSDFFSEIAALEMALSRLATRGRSASLVQIVDPFEVDFPFDGVLHFRDTIDDRDNRASLLTRADVERAAYLERFEAHRRELSTLALERGGRFSRVSTEWSDAEAVHCLSLDFGGHA